MAEWQSAADRNDPDAEFGLGSLYEFRRGGFEAKYKQADYWYRKAADHGNVEAPISSGADLGSGGRRSSEQIFAEAYQMVALAAKSKGVWSTLAADLNPSSTK